MEGSVKKKHFIGFAEVFFAFAASAFITCGRSIYNFNSLSGVYSKPGETAAVFALFFIPLLIFFSLAGKALIREKDGSVKVFRFMPLITSVLVAASCGVALASYFPGILGYDSEWQTLQALGLLPLSNHHPVLHTLLWNLFIALEWAGIPHPYGLALYCIFQILIVSFVCGCVVDREIKCGCGWTLPVLTTLFYVFYPVFSIFSVQMTKDVLFSCAVVLLFLVLSKFDDPEKVKKTDVLKIFILTLTASLLRNNFLPAAAFLFLISLILVKKDGIKKITASVLSALVFAVLIMKVLYPFAGVVPTESHELLSVPINQIAAVYVHEHSDLTVAEKFIIDEYMEAGGYNPRLADTVKFTFDDELYSSDRSAFWDLYMHLGAKYPEEFANAFLTQNVQLWYPAAAITDRYSAREYIETADIFIPEYPVERQSLLPAGLGFFEGFITSVENSGMAGRVLFSPAIPFYFCLLLLYIVSVTKKRGTGLAAAMILALWATYLLGPVSAFRYMYPFFLLIPAVLTPVFAGNVQADVSGAGESGEESGAEKKEMAGKKESSEKKEMAGKKENSGKKETGSLKSGDKKSGDKKIENSEEDDDLDVIEITDEMLKDVQDK